MLEVRDIVKTFGPLKANDNVSLSIGEGEIHALLGENGAGKSTLVKMLYGSLQPDAGEILWRGNPVTIASPFTARKTGIGMVFQHFSLFDSLSVADNIVLSLDREFGRGDVAERAQIVVGGLRTAAQSRTRSWAIFPLASASASRSSAACCRIRA